MIKYICDRCGDSHDIDNINEIEVTMRRINKSSSAATTGREYKHFHICNPCLLDFTDFMTDPKTEILKTINDIKNS